MHKGVARAPLVALGHQRPRALPARAADAAQEGREAEAVWVGRPPCDRLCRVGLLQGVDYGREVLLKAAWASGAALVWRGRGTLAVQPRRRHASHPRWAGTRRPRVAAIQAAAFGPVHTPPSGGGCVRAGERGTLGRGEEPPGPRVAAATVVHPCRPLLGIASGQEADPGDRVARDRGDWRGGPSVRQQPDNLPMAARHGLLGPAIGCGQCVNPKRCVDCKSFWHAIIIHEDLVSHLTDP